MFLCGSLIYGLGILLVSQTTSVWHLYLFYGVMAGLGNSAMNITPTIYGMAAFGVIFGAMDLRAPIKGQLILVHEGDKVKKGKG